MLETDLQIYLKSALSKAFFLGATETFKVPIFQKIVKGLLYKCQILSSSFFPSYKALLHSLREVSVHTCLEEYLFRKTPAKQVR